jgi:hypothetical protein
MSGGFAKQNVTGWRDDEHRNASATEGCDFRTILIGELGR